MKNNGINQLIQNINWRRGDFLYIPYRKKRQTGTVLDFTVGAHITYYDIKKEVLSLDNIIQIIQCLPLVEWFKFVSVISIYLDKEGLSNRDLHRSLAYTIPAGLREPVVKLIEEQNRFLIDPKALMALIKISFAYAPESCHTLPANKDEYLFTAYLALCDHINREFDKLDRQEQWDELLKWTIQNLDFGTYLNPIESIVRLWTILCKLPGENPTRDYGLDPNDIFKNSLGMDIETFLAQALSFIGNYWSKDFSTEASILKNLTIKQDLFFSKTKLMQDKIKGFFKNLTLSKRDIEKIKEEDPNSPDYFYNYSAFREHPLYRPIKDLYFPIYFPFFRWRISEGIYWDIFSAAPNNQQFASVFGQLLNKYVYRLFEKVLPPSDTLLQRLWREPPEDDPQAPKADLIIYYPGAYVFIEIKGHRFKYVDSVLHGNKEAIENDINIMLYDSAVQLNNAINYFRNGRFQLSGQNWNKERIYPIIVTYGSLPDFDPVWTELKKGFYERDCFTQGNINPLVVMDAEEVAILATLALKGFSLPDVLAEKTSSQYDGMPFKTYAFTKYKDISDPKYLLEDDWNSFTVWANHIFFNK